MKLGEEADNEMQPDIFAREETIHVRIDEVFCKLNLNLYRCTDTSFPMMITHFLLSTDRRTYLIRSAAITSQAVIHHVHQRMGSR